MQRSSGACLGMAFAVALLLAPFAPALAQHAHNHHDERALAEDPRLAPGQLAPRLDGLGDHHRSVTTSSEEAQRFFDQGLLLTYGFNHQEALRAFKEAARLDPDCAMAYWGWALVLGPNLNLPMQADVVAQAYEAVQTAVAHKGGASESEGEMIEALALRYSDDPAADRAPLDRAYADAMARLHEKYPDDNDVATLYAASLMNLSPWNYWTRDGRPKENTPTLLAALEGAIERDPQHEGALHYYIHAVEPVDPARGESAANLLRPLAPGAGHLTHMPSHIYMQLGRYAESAEVNALAAKADEGYIVQCNAQGIYPLGYYPHNVHFLAWAAIMQGRSTLALESSRKVASKVPDGGHEGNYWGLFQTFQSMPLYALARFGEWEAILAEPRPDQEDSYLLGVWHYTRALAYAHTDEVKKARKELSKLKSVGRAVDRAKLQIGFTPAAKLLTIAAEVVSGEIAAASGDHGEATAHLDRAVRLQDSLAYTEPPDWYYPVRHTLGAVLLEADRAVEAEVVYWQDLQKNPDNGYALFGLWQSLIAQGRDDAAGEIEVRWKKAWAEADFELTSSRF